MMIENGKGKICILLRKYDTNDTSYFILRIDYKSTFLGSLYLTFKNPLHDVK